MVDLLGGRASQAESRFDKTSQLSKLLGWWSSRGWRRSIAVISILSRRLHERTGEETENNGNNGYHSSGTRRGSVTKETIRRDRMMESASRLSRSGKPHDCKSPSTQPCHTPVGHWADSGDGDDDGQAVQRWYRKLACLHLSEGNFENKGSVQGSMSFLPWELCSVGSGHLTCLLRAHSTALR